MSAFDGNDRNWYWSESGNQSDPKGWKMATSTKYGAVRYIQKYMHTGEYQDIDEGLVTVHWANQRVVWSKQDYLITYANPMDNPALVKTVTIRMMSCNSNGLRFYGVGGRVQPPSPGVGAIYRCIIKIFDSYAHYTTHRSNPLETNNPAYTPTFTSTSVDIGINAVGPNIIRTGGPGCGGEFNWVEPCTHVFDFSSQQLKIPVGGILIIQVGLVNPAAIDNVIQVEMTGKDGSPDIDIEEEDRPYVWRYGTPPRETGVRWYLSKPVWVRKGGIWQKAEDVFRP